MDFADINNEDTGRTLFKNETLQTTKRSLECKYFSHEKRNYYI